MKRLYGSGSVTLDNEKWVARLPRAAGRKILGWFTTKEEAQSVLDGAIAQLADGTMMDTEGLPSLSDMRVDFFRAREASGIRSMKADRNRWETYISSWDSYKLPLSSITSRDIRQWRDLLLNKKATRHRNIGQSLAVQTVKNAFNLLRTAFKFAVEQGFIESSPCNDVAITKKSQRTDEPWTYLTLDEQNQLINCVEISIADRLLIQFAIGTGLRRGELFALQWPDVLLGANKHIVVRFGSPGKPTKSGKIRRVPLFGLALESIKQWHGMRSSPSTGTVWTFENGDQRQAVASRQWARYIKSAGIQRSVRFHDLRHTCASSLIAGWWGRKWTYDEVKQLLGHSTVKLTERYAHMADSVIESAAKETLAPIGQKPSEFVGEVANGPIFVNRRSWVQFPWLAPRKQAGLELGTEDADGQFLVNSKNYLVALVEGRSDVDELRIVLAQSVLNHPFVQLAMEALQDGPLAHAKTIELARQIIDSTNVGAATKKAGAK
jgi:integrase